MERMLTQEQVCNAFGVTRQAIRKWRDKGRFPEPIPLYEGSREIRWPESVITAHIEKLKQGVRK